MASEQKTPRPYGFFDERAKARYLELLSRSGQQSSSAYQVGVTAKTVQAHARQNPEFKAACGDALDRYRERIDGEVRRRGLEGVEEPVFFQGIVVGWLRKYSDQLLLAHAKRHVPEYRDRVQADLNVTGGVLVVGSPAESPQSWEDRFSSSPAN